MRNYYTLGDIRYLPNLICLIESMEQNFSEDYKVHALALDDKVSNFFRSTSYKNLIVYDLSEINEDFDIRAIRYLPAGSEAISNAGSSGKDPGFVQFCWALAPCFGEWLMSKIKKDVTYVDADILFFNDIKSFFEEVKGKSIGFVKHRIPYNASSGEYNVGVVHFNFDGPGRAALRKWKSFLIDPANQYSLCFGSCGDQKFLETLELIYPEDVKVVDHNFGHLAPWNVTFHSYDNEKILWDNKEQDLVYFHFAHFIINEDGFKTSYNNEWIWGEPLNVHSFVKNAYEAYYEKMKSAIARISQ